MILCSEGPTGISHLSKITFKVYGIKEHVLSSAESSEIETKMRDRVAVTLRVNAAGMRGGNAFSGTFRNIRQCFKPTSKHGWQCYVWINTKELVDFRKAEASKSMALSSG